MTSTLRSPEMGIGSLNFQAGLIFTPQIRLATWAGMTRTHTHAHPHTRTHTHTLGPLPCHLGPLPPAPSHFLVPHPLCVVSTPPPSPLPPVCLGARSTCHISCPLHRLVDDTHRRHPLTSGGPHLYAVSYRTRLAMTLPPTRPSSNRRPPPLLTPLDITAPRHHPHR